MENHDLTIIVFSPDLSLFAKLCRRRCRHFGGTFEGQKITERWLKFDMNIWCQTSLQITLFYLILMMAHLQSSHSQQFNL
jgi:hypothetical protein